MARLLVGEDCPTCHGMVQAFCPCQSCGGVTQEKPMVKKIQQMPDIWDDAEFMTSRNAVLGQFACCAVRQTPYTSPDRLWQAIEEMAYAISDLDDYFHTNCHHLQNLMVQSFEECPTVKAWNVPKKGDHQMVFVSRFETPTPDHDFIDLDALARNIAHGITLQEKYDGLHD